MRREGRGELCEIGCIYILGVLLEQKGSGEF